MAASAQQSSRPWRIGFLAGGERPTNFEGTVYSAFLRGMREAGYVENRDFSVEWRFAEGRFELFPSLADELVRAKVDVIVVTLTAAIGVVMRATDTIPIVMAVASDPVGKGYVTSLAHPTGNVTGLASFEDELVSKQLQLSALLLPNLRRVGFLLNRANPNHVSGSKALQDAVRPSNLTVIEAEFRKVQDVKDAFATLSRECTDVVLGTGDSVLFSRRYQIAEMALNLGLPTIFSQREFVEAGCLMSYGAPLVTTFGAQHFTWTSF
jgi:putative ABC transport system substrate-binding protein